MKYDAVIFDLFGTLVDYLPAEEGQRANQTTAGILSVDCNGFCEAWRQIMPERDLGHYGGIEGDIKHACALLRIQPTQKQIDAVIEVKLDCCRRELQPRAGAIETLTALRESGHKVGLITVCCSEVALLWNETRLASLMDECVFSCVEGITKPDPRIYHLVCERLVVKPENCLYVGDGSCRELTGALKVGMRPVLIQMAYDRDYGPNRVDAIEWRGPIVDSLDKVLSLVASPQPIPEPSF